jgi:hypothetical protein
MNSFSKIETLTTEYPEVLDVGLGSGEYFMESCSSLCGGRAGLMIDKP